MAWAFVQAPTPASENNGDGILACTFGGTTTLGNRIIVAITFRRQFNDPLTVSSVVDGQSNTYQQDRFQIIIEDGTNQIYMALWSAQITTAGTSTVTVTLSGSAMGIHRVAILEVSGLDTTSTPVDVAASAVGNSTSPNSGATAATAAANEVVIGVLGCPMNGSASAFTPAGWDMRAELIEQYVSLIWVGTKDSGASASTPSLAGTISEAAYWGALCAVYKLAAGAGGALPRSLVKSQAVHRASYF